MISPTPRAIFLMLLGVPLMVAIALLRPELWVISAGWVGGIASLIFADAVLAASLRAYEANVDAPALLYVGGSDPADLTLRSASQTNRGVVGSERVLADHSTRRIKRLAGPGAVILVAAHANTTGSRQAGQTLEPLERSARADTKTTHYLAG